MSAAPDQQPATDAPAPAAQESPVARAPRLSSEQVIPPGERSEFARRLANFGLGENRVLPLTSTPEIGALRPAGG